MTLFRASASEHAVDTALPSTSHNFSTIATPAFPKLAQKSDPSVQSSKVWRFGWLTLHSVSWIVIRPSRAIFPGKLLLPIQLHASMPAHHRALSIAEETYLFSQEDTLWNCHMLLCQLYP